MRIATEDSPINMQIAMSGSAPNGSATSSHGMSKLIGARPLAASIRASISWTPTSFFTRNSRTPMAERGSKSSGGRKDLPA